MARNATRNRNSKSSAPARNTLVSRIPAPVSQWIEAGIDAAAKARNTGEQALESARQQVSERTRKVQELAQARIEPVTAKVVGSLSSVERAASQQVCRVLSRVGVPTQKDIEKLNRSVAKLSQQIEQLAAAPRRAPRTASRRAA